jgi:hypothetical protein
VPTMPFERTLLKMRLICYVITYISSANRGKRLTYQMNFRDSAQYSLLSQPAFHRALRVLLIVATLWGAIVWAVSLP